jgi:hypothetical protein
MWRRGPAEIESRQKERMETVLKNAKITLLDLRIRFIRPDVAIVHETHEMSGMLSDDGKTMPQVASKSRLSKQIVDRHTDELVQPKS